MPKKCVRGKNETIGSDEKNGAQRPDKAGHKRMIKGAEPEY